MPCQYPIEPSPLAGEGVDEISSPLLGREERIPLISSPLMGED